MLAVRANERAAAGTGINVIAVKLVAFAIAALIAGIGGTLPATAWLLQAMPTTADLLRY